MKEIKAILNRVVPTGFLGSNPGYRWIMRYRHLNLTSISKSDAETFIKSVIEKTCTANNPSAQSRDMFLTKACEMMVLKSACMIEIRDAGGQVFLRDFLSTNIESFESIIDDERVSKESRQMLLLLLMSVPGFVQKGNHLSQFYQNFGYIIMQVDKGIKETVSDIEKHSVSVINQCIADTELTDSDIDGLLEIGKGCSYFTVEDVISSLIDKGYSEKEIMSNRSTVVKRSVLMAGLDL